MAKFEEEFKSVIFNEGGYVNDPDDNGGETYMGISRKANPNWDGWKIIDSVKKVWSINVLSSKLKKDNILTSKVKSIYKTKYWDCFNLDDIPSQSIAHQLFDTAVNMGNEQAIKIIQKTIGVKVTGKWSNNLKQKLKKI